MRIIKEKLPVFTLENKYFDKLNTAAQIAIYAFIQRIVHQEIYLSFLQIKNYSNEIGISDYEFKNAIDMLVAIGCIEISTDDKRI